MLNESKQVYEKYADIYINDWRLKDKNELCFIYVDSNDSVYKDNLLYAIIVKFWYVFDTFVPKCKFMPVENTYDMYIDSLQYTLNKAVWKDESSSVYNDRTAPERCLTTRMKSQRLNKLRDLGRQERVLNLLAIPIESFNNDDYDEGAENLLCDNKSYDSDLLIDNVKFIVSRCFSRKQYFRSLLIYILSTSPYAYNDVRGKRFVLDAIRQINDEFCDEFASMFNISEDFVKSTYSRYKNMSQEELRRQVNNTFSQLKNCSDVREMLNAY